VQATSDGFAALPVVHLTIGIRNVIHPMIKGQFGRGPLLLAVLIICSQFVTAQDFRPGYIITLSGDSVKGHVRYGSARRNERECSFKPSRGTPKQKYSAGQLTGYGIFGDRSFTVIDDPKQPGQKVFARVVVSGDMDLFRRGKQFLLNTDRVQILPPETRTTIAVNNGEAFRTERPYAAILNMEMADCSKSNDDVSYSEKELTHAVDQYNLCKDPKYKSIQSRPIAQTGLNVFASYMYSDMFLKYDHASMSPSTFMAYGIGADFSSPRINDKIFLSLEIAYADMFYQGLIDGPSSGYYLREDVYMSFKSIRLAAALRYNLLEASRTPYLKVGFTYYSVIDDDIHSVAEKEYSEGIIMTDESTGGYEVKGPKGFYLGIGYQQSLSRKLKFFVEGRYETMEGFVGTAIQSFSELTNYSVMFGLRIN